VAALLKDMILEFNIVKINENVSILTTTKKRGKINRALESLEF
jgi:hypothetical protein